MILLIPSIILLFFYCILIVYYRQVWKQIPIFKKPVFLQPKTRITVIIPARNEEKNIQACLDSLCKQDFPKELLEIIVADDHSTDITAAIVKRYSDQGISLLSLEKEMSGVDARGGSKKAALAAGIKKASGTLIITTDADCIFPQQWLSTLVAFYEVNKPVFIAAPVKFSQEQNALHIFQSLDFLSLQGITAASVFSRFHTMCNGANLAYEKKVFEEAGGFAGIDQIASGDDMLLMHKIYLFHPDKVMYCLSPDTIVDTKPAESVKAFLNQRIRWASKALVYHDKRIFYVLLLVYLLNFFLLSLLIYSFFSKEMLLYWILLLTIKTIFEVTFLLPVASFYKKASLLWYFFPAQPFHILYTVIAGFLGQAGSYEWKGRKLK
jgi:cellulose synthase/poly-beta-1,6-N-acetylglucosamine synthase-like glycosyltransferase